MPAKKTTTKKALTLAQLMREADRAMAQEKHGARDSATDRLFALLMARLDVWQAHRTAALPLLEDLRSQPAQLPLLAKTLMASMAQALDQAGLKLEEPRGAAQTIGLFTVYLATLRAWQKDTSADLSATMRALDRNLQRAARVGAWLGFEAR